MRRPRIERYGLAARSPDHSDGRAVLVLVTPAGAKVVGSRRKERIGRLAALAGQLDPHHRQALAASLPALLEMGPVRRPTTQQADGTSRESAARRCTAAS